MSEHAWQQDASSLSTSCRKEHFKTLKPTLYNGNSLILSSVATSHSDTTMSTSVLSSVNLQPQVEQKESSSGFMLLSVKHLSKVKRDRRASSLAATPDSTQLTSVSDVTSCGTDPTTPQFMQQEQYFQPGAVEAEEYDDDEDDDDDDDDDGTEDDGTLGVEPSDSFSKTVHLDENYGLPTIPIEHNKIHAMLTDAGQDYSSTDQYLTQSDGQYFITLGEGPNMAQPQGVLGPVSAVNNWNENAAIKAAQHLLHTHPISDAHLFHRQDSSSNSVVSNTDPLHATTAFQFYHQQPYLRQHTTSDLIAATNGLYTTANAPSAISGDSARMLATDAFAHFDISKIRDKLESLLPSGLFDQGLPPDAVPLPPAVPHQLCCQSSDEPIPLSLLEALTSPMQPASRFRKARIRETVEQWCTNKLLIHDCRLKAVPSWVLDLQSSPQPAEATEEEKQWRGSRCICCFVPQEQLEFSCDVDPETGRDADPHGPCHLHHSTNQDGVAGSLCLSRSDQVNKLTSSTLGLLQATVIAYKNAFSEDQNASELLSLWDGGMRTNISLSHSLTENAKALLRANLHLSGKAEIHLANSPPAALSREADPSVVCACNDASYPIAFDKTLPNENPISGDAVQPSVVAQQASDPSTAYLRRHLDSRYNDMPETFPSDVSTHVDSISNRLPIGVESSVDKASAYQPNTQVAESPSIPETVASQGVPPTSPAFGFPPSLSPIASGPLPNHIANAADALAFSSRQGHQSNLTGTSTHSILGMLSLLSSRGVHLSDATVNTLVRNSGGDSTHLQMLSSPPPSPDPELCAAFQSYNLPCNPPALHPAENDGKVAYYSNLYDSQVPPSSDVHAAITTMKPSNGLPSGATNDTASENDGAATVPCGTVLQQSEGSHQPFSSETNYNPTEAAGLLPASTEAIRLAIVSTLKEELAPLQAENAVLRVERQRSIMEILELRIYQRGLQALQPFVPTEIWEQITAQIKLEAEHQLRQFVAHQQIASALPPMQTLQYPPLQHQQLSSTSGFIGRPATAIGILASRPLSPQTPFPAMATVTGVQTRGSLISSTAPSCVPTSLNATTSNHTPSPATSHPASHPAVGNPPSQTTATTTVTSTKPSSKPSLPDAPQVPVPPQCGGPLSTCVPEFSGQPIPSSKKDV